MAQLLHLTEQVAFRLRHNGYQGRTVQLKVRFGDFKTITRSLTLPEPSANTSVIWQTAKELFTTRLPTPLKPVRLIGVGVSGFETDAPCTQHASPVQQELFDTQTTTPEAQPGPTADALDNVTDAVKQRFGTAAMKRGRSILRSE